MAEGDLTTLASFKDYAQIDQADTSNDAVLGRLITWASSLVRTYVGREFTIPVVVETRVIHAHGGMVYYLGDKLTDVTQIKAPAQYFVEGETVAYSDLITNYDLNQRPTGTILNFYSPVKGKMEISGTWGWAEVPHDVEYATIIAVDTWYRGNVIAPWNPPDDQEQERGGIKGTLPGTTKDILDPWRLNAELV